MLKLVTHGTIQSDTAGSVQNATDLPVDEPDAKVGVTGYVRW